MVITRAGYERLAEIIRSSELADTWYIEERHAGEVVRARIVEQLCEWFESDMGAKRFNKQKFIDACYGVHHKEE